MNNKAYIPVVYNYIPQVYNMLNLTKNESRTISFLIRHFNEKNSINGLSKKLNLSPRGAEKILKKLEDSSIAKLEKLNHSAFYTFNFDDESAIKIGEFVLLQNDLNSYAKVQADDLQKLKPYTLSCMLFGSVLTKGKEANDIDAILILDKSQLEPVSKVLNDIKKLKPKKIQELLFTKEDFEKNLREKNQAIVDALNNGKILWGSSAFLEAIRNVATRPLG
ncbi:hypothetical protein HYU11_06315 [Candidatus Woesearchaeota archaeon]|nr:hypothetical protein [Candidatus Woesearchaeota archaeon]